MEALATVDEVQHAAYQVADRTAAAEGHANEAQRVIEDLRARLTQQEEQHAREVARWKSEAEQHARDVARLESEVERREEERAADLGAAQARIGELTGQLAAERRERRVDQGTIARCVSSWSRPRPRSRN
ncbi:hypothetical protein AB0E88_04095 [Streptomyces sp. NPDC028635]|uniref:hypothetical protein n=1 Tax=Streptomyces sp. NPDC028635 TaxID=3154800 RepID=UPI00340C15B3